MSSDPDRILTAIKSSCSAMRDALLRDDYDRFLFLESKFYSEIVKVIETAAHYELCYSELDSIGYAYGDTFKEVRKHVGSSLATPRVCYLLPNIDNDLAHVEFLYNVLKHHDPKSNLEIFVAGYAAHSKPSSSRFLSQLSFEGKISLLKIPDSHAGRVEFAKFFFERSFSQLIVYSIPFQLSGWVRALGPDLVTWVTTKFELSAFKDLRNRVSFWGGAASIQKPGLKTATHWRRSSAAISRKSVIPYFPSKDSRRRLVTINRTEKINTPEFLRAVSSILVAEPAATFAWTGRSLDPEIARFFEAAGVGSRCEFIGWVDPSSTLREYDIFLDTFGLSGVVATQAFCSGMPVMFFRNSKAWVEIHEYALDEFPALRPAQVLARSVDEYVKATLELIRDPASYLNRSESQRNFAESFFFDEKTMYDSHVAIIKNIIESDGR